MKSQIYTALLIVLLTTAANIQAQPKSAAQEADDLRLQLLDLQTQEEGLKAHAAQLDEALKPENIERSLAGVGSTRPEELREARRRQLQIERDGVAAQLRTLEAGRQRLEAALRDAEARAYHESAGVASNGMFSVQSILARRWLVGGGAGGFVAALVAGLFIRRRLRARSRN
jgi:hypothetical protein